MEGTVRFNHHHPICPPRCFKVPLKSLLFFSSSCHLSHQLRSGCYANIRHLHLSKVALRTTCLPSSWMPSIHLFLGFPQRLFPTTISCPALFTRSPLFILSVGVKQQNCTAWIRSATSWILTSILIFSFRNLSLRVIPLTV